MSNKTITLWEKCDNLEDLKKRMLELGWEDISTEDDVDDKESDKNVILLVNKYDGNQSDIVVKVEYHNFYNTLMFTGFVPAQDKVLPCAPAIQDVELVIDYIKTRTRMVHGLVA